MAGQLTSLGQQKIDLYVQIRTMKVMLMYFKSVMHKLHAYFCTRL